MLHIKLVSGTDWERFRLVRRQLDTLKNCRAVSPLVRMVNALPKTLYDTYTQIMDNIDRRELPDALKTLQWLVYAVQPLEIDKIRGMLAVDTCESRPQYEPENRYCIIPREIMRICSSLITTTLEWDNSGVIKLVHLSPKKYL
jgi:hypothetical protein